MSAYHEIYFRELNPDRPVLSFLDRAFGWTFQQYARPDVLVAVGPEFSVDYEPEFVLDDDGLPFSTHRSRLTFRNLAGDKDAEYRTASDTYDALVRSGDFSCFLMFDAQRLLAKDVVRLEPPAPAASLILSLAAGSPVLVAIVRRHLETNEDVLATVVLEVLADRFWAASSGAGSAAEAEELDRLMAQLADAYSAADADVAEAIAVGLIAPLGGHLADASDAADPGGVRVVLPEPIGSAVDESAATLLAVRHRRTMR